MATGLEVIGGLSAILTTSGQLAALGGKFRRCVKTLSYAKEEILEVEEQTSNFSALLSMFHHTMQTMAKKGNSMVRETEQVDLTYKISRRSERILLRIKSLLAKVELLRTDKNHSALLRGFEKLKWLMNKDDVKPLCEALNAAKLDLLIFTNLLNLNDAKEEIARLKVMNIEISADLEQQVAAYESQVKQLQRRCEEAEEKCEQLEFSPTQQHSDRLDPAELDITRVLARLVQRELEPGRLHELERRSFELSSSLPSPSNLASAKHSSIEKTVNAPPAQPDTDREVITIEHAPRTPAVPNLEPITVDETERSSSSVESVVGPRTGKWVPMPGWGEPRPQERPCAPRASQEDLPLGIVHYDDGTQLREEYRRPRRSRHQVRSQEHNHHHSSSGGSALSGGSSGGESDSNIGSGSGASVLGEER